MSEDPQEKPKLNKDKDIKKEIKVNEWDFIHF